MKDVAIESARTALVVVISIFFSLLIQSGTGLEAEETTVNTEETPDDPIFLEASHSASSQP